MNTEQASAVDAYFVRYESLIDTSSSGEKVALSDEINNYLSRNRATLEPWAIEELESMYYKLRGGDAGFHYAMTGPTSIAGRGDEFESEDQSPFMSGVNSYIDDPNKLDAEYLNAAAKKINPLGIGGIKTLFVVVVIGIVAVSLAYSFYQGFLSRAARAGAGK